MKKRNVLLKTIFLALFIVFSISILNVESFAIDIPVENNKNITFTFDEEVKGYKQIDSIYNHHNIIGWHHSGGYWTIGGKTLHDRDIPNGNLNKLDEIFLQKLDHRPIKVEYPPKVKQAIKEGKKVKVKLRINSKYFGPQNYIRDIDKPSQHKVKHTSNGLELRLPLKFNYEEDYFGKILTYQDYGIDLKFQMPIIKRGFGQNGYSIYKSNGNRSGEWASYWNYDQPVTEGHIHPTIINKNGRLKSGHSINTSQGKRNSSSIRIEVLINLSLLKKGNLMYPQKVNAGLSLH